MKQLSSLWFVLLVFAYIVASGGHQLHLIGNHSVGQVVPIARAGGPTKVLSLGVGGGHNMHAVGWLTSAIGSQHIVDEDF